MQVMSLPIPVREWRDDGRYIEHAGNQIYVMDTNSHQGRFVFMLHGFPSSSYDYHLVVPELAKRVRVVAFDLLGFGLSDKPDARYSIFDQTDLAIAVAADCGIERCVLVAHDMGDTVAAELLMRQHEGTLPFTVERAILTNGSIFIDMAQLSAGQQFLLSLPDEKLAEPMGGDGARPGLKETFG
ncbi:MAG: alpha/beta fold hydrolase, partial [Actinomycetota bacterium]